MNRKSQVRVSEYTIVVKLQETTDHGYCYVAFHPELPYVLSQGDTAEEAQVNLAEATEMAIEHLVRHGLPVPEPKSFGEPARFDLGEASPVMDSSPFSAVPIQPVFCT